MDNFIGQCQDLLSRFLVFNQNFFYYILFFVKNYWIYLFVVASIVFMFYYEVKEADESYIDDKRRII